jgi:hypothetical protein
MCIVATAGFPAMLYLKRVVSGWFEEAVGGQGSGLGDRRYEIGGRSKGKAKAKS